MVDVCSPMGELAVQPRQKAAERLERVGRAGPLRQADVVLLVPLDGISTVFGRTTKAGSSVMFSTQSCSKSTSGRAGVAGWMARIAWSGRHTWDKTSRPRCGTVRANDIRSRWRTDFRSQRSGRSPTDRLSQSPKELAKVTKAHVFKHLRQ